MQKKDYNDKKNIAKIADCGEEERLSESSMIQIYIYIILTAVLFATMEVALKLTGSHMDSFQLTFLRFMIGGILLLPIGLHEKKKTKVILTIKDYGYLMVLGIFAIPVSMLFFQFAIMKLNASTASVLICINPLFTMIFAHFILNERLNKAKLISLLFGIFGIFFMIRPWDMQEGNTLLGVVYILIAAISFGYYTVLGKKTVQRIGVVYQTAVSFIFGSLVLLIIILLMGRPVLYGVGENIAAILYVSIFVTGIGYYFYFMSIKKSDATTGSIAFFIKPAIAPVIAVMILKDVICWNTYVGILMILAASFINLWKSKNR